MPSGAVGADLDDMFDAADEAGGTLTAEIYDKHWYDGVPTKAQAQKRYRARCAAKGQEGGGQEAGRAAAADADAAAVTEPTGGRQGAGTQAGGRQEASRQAGQVTRAEQGRGDGQGEGQGPEWAAHRPVQGHAGAAEADVPAVEAVVW